MTSLIQHFEAAYTNVILPLAFVVKMLSAYGVSGMNSNALTDSFF